MSSGPSEKCDTQTDDEPKEEEETLTPAQVRQHSVNNQ
jgi:hypothetical protein